MDKDRIAARTSPGVVVATLGTVVLGVAVAWGSRTGLGEPQSLVSLGLGSAWAVVALLTLRRLPVAVLSLVVAVAWILAGFAPAAVMWHRAALVLLLLAGAAWRPRTWTAMIVTLAAGLASVLTWPWLWPWTAVGLGVALLAGAASERRSRAISVARLAPWRAATVLTAAAVAVPPLLTVAGLGRAWALSVLLSYAAAQVVVAALVVLAVRRRTHSWATDLAVDLRSPSRELLEEALHLAGADTGGVRREAEAALAAARNLEERLAARQTDLTRTVAETERSRRRLESAEARERRALRVELELVTLGRLRSALAILATTSGSPADQGANDLVRRAVDLLIQGVEDLDRLGAGLTPAPLEGATVPALARLAASAPIPVELDLPAADRLERLPDNLRASLYFVASEALTNVVKHAHASKARLRLRLGPDVELLLEDDGVGTTATASTTPTAAGNGAGIEGMRARAAELGGRLEVSSRPGEGTSVRLTVPSPRDERAAATGAVDVTPATQLVGEGS